MAELIGPLMLDSDRRYRTYRFRNIAGRVIDGMRPDHRELLRAYTEGVNDGLYDLEAFPLEYQILQSNLVRRGVRKVNNASGNASHITPSIPSVRALP